ncbi:MAG: hypothetical protein A2751_02875 [Candidatus Doudnabacteria bacterium RIFCSPHIGHO2_01_FULL_46_14]|uniref:Phosphoenolpyruvate synthase n=1 Tax=Candidatus Doudnabacteria bacterium RIFCSPHIGHO2_01_FULL_46_14 TaxID=1817824 RepID=A0A1F5NKN5_9BACT|nr:MAG: hypothetical protein A2751_02875 [Candidatus Doudnabacteria bacterium RIFCSPHIGHO2_01_FULL_46_14]
MDIAADFKEISKKDVRIAGGKGASLGEMTRAGFPIPPGFIIISYAFNKFLAQGGLDSKIETILKKVKRGNAKGIDEASREIRDLITKARFPTDLEKQIKESFKKLNSKFAAVRSSATAEDSKLASWAGELETYLNVTDKNLLGSVKKCWSSLFTPRAIFYRFENNLSKTAISVAVVIQKMIQSEISGVCFTVHPVTKNRNQMIIEAGFGLGEAIVGGLITPDNYVLNKKDPSILNITVNEQSMAIVQSEKGNIQKKMSLLRGRRQKLSSAQIITLAKICKKIEQHYHEPQDIEWAFEKGRFYITQSRPITTL